MLAQTQERGCELITEKMFTNIIIYIYFRTNSSIQQMQCKQEIYKFKL